MLRKIMGLCLMIGYASLAWGSIVTTYTVEGIKKETCKANEKTLILFDVDKVLIVPTKDFIFEDPVRWKEVLRLVVKYPGNRIYPIAEDYFKNRTVEILDPHIIPLLKDLESKKIPMTALTQWKRGNFGSIKIMEDLRFKELNQVGISFLKTSPFKDQTHFVGFKDNEGPLVKWGCIITGFVDKGPTLKAVLKASPLTFEKVIFIDDKISNLKSVQTTCTELGIEFCGVHYKAADALPLPHFDKKKERVRFQILEKERVWLTDEALEARLKSV